MKIQHIKICGMLPARAVLRVNSINLSLNACIGKEDRDFPGGPVVKNLSCNAGTPALSLVRELRSHMQRGN